MKSQGSNITIGFLGLCAALIVGNLYTASTDPVVPKTPEWSVQLAKEIQKIDATTEGNLGVSVKKIGSEESMDHQGSRSWYLASTVKVPVAIAILQLVEEGKLRLDQQLVIKGSDAVDGSGEVQFKRPGTRVSIAYLVEKMLIQSDSTATDMLIRLIGEDDLNARIRLNMSSAGFGRVTTILQVRKDAFGFLHPKAHQLTNRHFIDLKKYRSSTQKMQTLSRQMGVPQSEFQKRSVEEAFETYYQQGINSGSLMSFANLLENLSSGKYLTKPHTDLILRHMSRMTTGERRLKAGLPKGIHFAQKTGTQVARICNVGIATSPSGEAVAVAACLEKFKNYPQAERTMKLVGEALGRSLVKTPRRLAQK